MWAWTEQLFFHCIADTFEIAGTANGYNSIFGTKNCDIDPK
jgi:hypothetical protein